VKSATPRAFGVMDKLLNNSITSSCYTFMMISTRVLSILASDSICIIIAQDFSAMRGGGRSLADARQERQRSRAEKRQARKCKYFRSL